MSIIDEILEYNAKFVQEKRYEKFQTTKYPNKKMVILTCMDTRLIELLPQSMNLRNGDVKIIKNAGAVISHPFGSIMRSILVAIYALKADEVCIIGHHGCGMSGLESSCILDQVEDRGISKETVKTITSTGVNIDEWLSGFESVQESVAHSVDLIKNHPLLPPGIPVHGLVICPETGKLDVIVKDSLSLNPNP